MSQKFILNYKYARIHQLVYISKLFQAKVSELWYVEEYDVLALALNGKMKVRRLDLGCNED
jgi:hypothetical protein